MATSNRKRFERYSGPMRSERRGLLKNARRMSTGDGGEASYALLQNVEDEREDGTSSNGTPLVEFRNDKAVVREPTTKQNQNCHNDNHRDFRSETNASERTCSSSRSSIDMSKHWDILGVYSWSPPSWKVKLMVAVCGVIIVVGVTLIIHYHDSEPPAVRVGDSSLGVAEINIDKKLLRFFDGQGVKRLSISLAGDNYSSLTLKNSQPCDGHFDLAPKNACLKWPTYKIVLRVDQMDKMHQQSKISCFKVSWKFASSSPKDCMLFGMSGEGLDQPVWYDTMRYIIWPKLQRTACRNFCDDYVPTSTDKGVDLGGTVLEPLWLSSQAAALRVSLRNHVKACMEICRDASQSTLCLNTEDNSSENNSAERELAYSVCFGSNVTELHSEVMENIVKSETTSIFGSDITKLPAGSISNTTRSSSKELGYAGRSVADRCNILFTKPLWNIALNKDGYKDQKEMIKDLKHITSIGGTGVFSNLSEVYSKVGDFKLRDHPELNMRDFVIALHSMNFSVMLPVSPFVNYDAEHFKDTLHKELLLQSEFQKSPVLTDVHQLQNDLYPGVIDFTKPDSSKWFNQELQNFTQTYNIEFLLLMYGQISWLPKHYRTFSNLSNPGLFSTLYTSAAEFAGSCPLTDVAFSSQNQKQLVLLKPVGDMKKTLAMALAAGLAGYPFFIPNLPFRLEEVGMLPSEQLEDGFIRWIQLVSFFPVAHIPWDFKVLKERKLDTARLVSMIQKCIAIRSGKIVGGALRFAIENAEKGHSFIISPMWMAPGLPERIGDSFTTERIYLIDDQFMIGDNLFFAPILEIHSQQRDVYFPPGKWAKLGKPTRKFESEGTLWVKKMDVPPDDLLIFVRDDA